jgi:preprotein translocase SecE subunit
MATAVQIPSPTATVSAQSSGDRLLPASLMAAGFILAAVFVAGYAVPKLLGSTIGGGTFFALFVRLVVQVAAIVGLVWLGGRLAGDNPPKGLRGGIFIVISTFFTVFFLFRAIGLNLSGPIGQGVTAVAGLGLLFSAYKFLTSPRARDWMISLEEQGWFHTFSYKRTQGLRMRRYTIMGILLVGLSGVYTLMNHGYLGAGDLTLAMPFIDGGVTLLSDKNYTIPLLLTAGVLWLAWRSVNMPGFADFLIATEAEMNKVSWTPRKRLIQDTIVVLVTTLVLTVFLLLIDLFWGWLLSLNFIGILPSKDDLKSKKNATPVTEQVAW